MKKTLVVASRNKDKLSEIREILECLDLKILSLHDFPGFPEITEDGKTLLENAVKKAKTAMEITNLVAIGEDTGLEIEYLKGAPGVYTARFAGPGCTYSDNNGKVLDLLKGVPEKKRKARFRTVAAIAVPGEDIMISEGEVSGYITSELKGNKGFGYDPIFMVPEYGKTFAELDDGIKNNISHRAKAIDGCRKKLSELFSRR